MDLNRNILSNLPAKYRNISGFYIMSTDIAMIHVGRFLKFSYID